MLPERLRLLEVTLGSHPCGRLTKGSQYTFQYGRDDPAQPALALLMPPQRLQYASNSLFAAMDVNLPEDYLFQQLRNMFPKQPLTDMHLLALMGSNGIGRMGYRSPEQPRPTPPATVSKGDVLRAGAAGAVSNAGARLPVHWDGGVGHSTQNFGARPRHAASAHVDREGRCHQLPWAVCQRVVCLRTATSDTQVVVGSSGGSTFTLSAGDAQVVTLNSASILTSALVAQGDTSGVTYVYQWSQVGVTPVGITISNANSATASFAPTVIGTYTVQVQVIATMGTGATQTRTATTQVLVTP